MKRLIQAAIRARSHAYAPYSGFHVGAALLTESSNVYVGCNVENASYGATLCAERAAVAAMVAAGDTRPLVCAIVTNQTKTERPTPPCGICRQVLAEFAPDVKLLLVALRANGGTVQEETHLSSLLPQAFRLDATDAAGAEPGAEPDQSGKGESPSKHSPIRRRGRARRRAPGNRTNVTRSRK
jgi:cytidine deaminase